MAPISPDKNIGHSRGPEAAPTVVSQPTKVVNLNAQMSQLGSFLEEVNRISESSPGSAGEQWSGAGTGTAVATAQQTSAAGISPRDQAIANIPAPAIMQKELAKHIHAEVKQLRKQAQLIASSSKPGGAYHMNILYTRIRHLNALLAEIFEASYDVLKRLFVKVFIDKQTIL